MPDPKYLDMIVSQVQGKTCLANTSNPKYLDLEVSHVQSNDHPPLAHPREWDNVNLANMPDSRHLDFVVSQV
jgi:hypothetical protein